jgi:hypothetical protein
MSDDILVIKKALHFLIEQEMLNEIRKFVPKYGYETYEEPQPGTRFIYREAIESVKKKYKPLLEELK